MGYTTDDSRVRVDFFKPSGKWYMSEEINWYIYRGDIHSVFSQLLNEQFGKGLDGLTAVCLEPNHEFAHPLMKVMGE